MVESEHLADGLVLVTKPSDDGMATVSWHEGKAHTDVLTLQEGVVEFRSPARMSQESFGDLKDWIEIVMRKVARGVRE